MSSTENTVFDIHADVGQRFSLSGSDEEQQQCQQWSIKEHEGEGEEVLSERVEEEVIKEGHRMVGLLKTFLSKTIVCDTLCFKLGLDPVFGPYGQCAQKSVEFVVADGKVTTTTTTLSGGDQSGKDIPQPPRRRRWPKPSGDNKNMWIADPRSERFEELIDEGHRMIALLTTSLCERIVCQAIHFKLADAERNTFGHHGPISVQFKVVDDDDTVTIATYPTTTTATTLLLGEEEVNRKNANQPDIHHTHTREEGEGEEKLKFIAKKSNPNKIIPVYPTKAMLEASRQRAEDLRKEGHRMIRLLATFLSGSTIVCDALYFKLVDAKPNQPNQPNDLDRIANQSQQSMVEFVVADGTVTTTSSVCTGVTNNIGLAQVLVEGEEDQSQRAEEEEKQEKFAKGVQEATGDQEVVARELIKEGQRMIALLATFLRDGIVCTAVYFKLAQLAKSCSGGERIGLKRNSNIVRVQLVTAGDKVITATTTPTATKVLVEVDGEHKMQIKQQHQEHQRLGQMGPGLLNVNPVSSVSSGLMLSTWSTVLLASLLSQRLQSVSVSPPPSPSCTT